MKKNNTTSGCLTIFAAIVAIAVVIFFIALAMPLMLILGSFGIWYYSKKISKYQKTKGCYRSHSNRSDWLIHRNSLGI